MCWVAQLFDPQDTTVLGREEEGKRGKPISPMWNFAIVVMVVSACALYNPTSLLLVYQHLLHVTWTYLWLFQTVPG